MNSNFDLEKSVKELMNFFRETWPNESVTPKLHMLEDHAGDFMRKWGLGLGIYGEQGEKVFTQSSTT